MFALPRPSARQKLENPRGTAPGKATRTKSLMTLMPSCSALRLPRLDPTDEGLEPVFPGVSGVHQRVTGGSHRLGLLGVLDQ